MDRRNKLLTGAAGLGVLAVLLHRALAADEAVFWLSVLFLGALAVVSESLGSDQQSPGRTTYGIIPLTAAILALNTLSAVLVALCAAVSLRDIQRRRSPLALAFNGLQYALAVSAASFVYHALGGVTRAFELGKTLRSIPFLLLAMTVFWAVNTALVSLAVHWEHGISPLDFLRKEALRMLPHQLAYGLLGMALGVIYAQNAFHLSYLNGQTGELIDKLPEGTADPAIYLGPYVMGTAGEAFRGFAASLMFLATLGVAWSFSGRNLALLGIYDRATERLCAYLEEREPYLRGHASRVAAYAQMLAVRLGMSSYDRRKLRYAALLHDLGKATVPREILLQKGSLGEEEFLAVQRHTLAGSNWLEEIPYLANTAGAVLHHHEYFDGGGYPDGIAGDTIPPAARILTVADAYDAMLSPRPWRKAKTPDAAAAELRQNSGVQFDPEMVKTFLEALQEGGAGAAAPSAETEASPPAAAEEPQEGVRGRGWQPESRERPRRKTRMGKRRQHLLEERRRRREAALAPRGISEDEGEEPGNGDKSREAPGDAALPPAERGGAKEPGQSGDEGD